MADGPGWRIVLPGCSRLEHRRQSGLQKWILEHTSNQFGFRMKAGKEALSRITFNRRQGKEGSHGGEIDLVALAFHGQMQREVFLGQSQQSHR